MDDVALEEVLVAVEDCLEAGSDLASPVVVEGIVAVSADVEDW